ncbi:MAG: lipopolysaccharide biosynthesis protein [Alistipes sp.]|nr:lipopolysaccharide biosynthesis protein [Alistipes sp.]
MGKERDLSERVASGVAWNITEKVGSTLLQAIVSIIVANRIMPNEMGVIAVMTILVTLSQVVIDSGFSQTLIRKTDASEGDFKAVFRFNIWASVLLYAILTASAPLVASYYGWEKITSIAPVLYLLLPLNALCVIQNTIMVKEFRFAELSTIIFTSSLISSIIAIAMALTGFGIWSLVGQRVSMMAIKAMLLWWKSSWRYRRDTDGSSLQEMTPYSLRLIATDMITAIYNNIAQLFIGKMYSANMLGYYNQAQKLKDMPVNATMQSIQSVTFPALAKISDDDEKFKEGYRRVMMLTAFVMFPMMAGLIATAEDIFQLLLKPQWHPSVPYFQILSLVGLLYPISAIAYNVLKVRSNGAIILRLEILKKVLMTIILAITIPIGVKAIAWGMVAAAACEMILNTGATTRYCKFTVTLFARTLLPIALLTVAMFFATEFVGNYTIELHVGWRLAIKIAIGVATYSLGALLTRMEALSEAVTIARRLLGKLL